MGLKVIKISQYRDNCIGCGVCAYIAPQTWTMSDEDGRADLVNAEDKKTCFTGDITEIDLEDNIRAQDECPVHCIKVHN